MNNSTAIFNKYIWFFEKYFNFNKEKIRNANLHDEHMFEVVSLVDYNIIIRL